MCGLVGVLGSLDDKAIEIFNDLLVMNQLRGAHSTGVATVDRGMRVHLVKSLGPPNYVRALDQYKELVHPDQMLIMGHGRHATVGKIIPGNAHPFHMENIVGAHNGTLSYLTRRDLDSRDFFGTDSEALMQAISDKGLSDVVPTLSGAWALTVYDKVFDTFSMIRNKERPLSYARINDNKTMIWASEAWMLAAACHRADVPMSAGPFDVVEDHLFTWDMVPEGGVLAHPKKSKLPGKPIPVVVDYSNATSGRRGTGGNNGPTMYHGRRGWWFDGDFYPIDGNGQPWTPPSLVFGAPRANPLGFHNPPGNRPGALAAGLRMALNNADSIGRLEDGPVKSKSSSVATPRNYSGLSRHSGGLTVSVTYADEHRDKFQTNAAYRLWIEQGCMLTEGLNPIYVEPREPRKSNFILPKDERGRMMSQETFDKRTRHGCDGCGGNLHWGSAVKFIDHQTALGECCYNDNELMNWLQRKEA